MSKGMGRLVSCSAVALMVATSAHAQVAPAAGAPAQTPTDVSAQDTVPAQDIVVTGSRIHGVGPVGSDLITVGARDLQASPKSTVTDMLREVPQISTIGVTEATVNVQGVSTSNLGRTGAVNLHGLGPEATLVLLDNHRMIGSSAGGLYVDPGTIPAIALSRVDVVPDGASAIYGSDAIGGVVNMVVRQNYSGAETRLQYGFADGYHKVQASQLLGTKWTGGSVLLAYEFLHTTNLNGTDRSFYRSDQTARGGKDYRSTFCAPGTVQIGTTTYPLPSLAAGSPNRCDLTQYSDILPRQTKHSILLSGHQDLTDNLQFYVQGYYSHRDEKVSNGVIGGQYTVPSTNAYFVSPTGTTPASELVSTNFLNAFGDYYTRGTTETMNGTAGLKLAFGHGWHAEAAASAGRDKEVFFRDTLNNSALATALSSNNTSTALNPFGANGMSASSLVISGLFTGLFNPNFLNKTAGAELRLDGPLFDLPAGAVQVAAGAEYRDYSENVNTVRGTTSAPSSFVVTGSRHVKSVYGELYVPVFGASNAAPLLQRLDLSAAVRYDSYDDVGNTTNPKIGVNWSPVGGLMLHGSFGTSFRAPALSDILSPSASISVQNWVDPLSPTGTSSGLSYSSFSAPLKPETATTWSFGADIKPQALPGLMLNASYWSVNYTNQVNKPQANILQLASFYSDRIIRNPTAAQVSALLASGLPVSGTVPPIVAFIANITPGNLGTTKASGIDFRAAYDFDAGGAHWQVGGDGSYNIRYDVSLVPGGAFIKEVGEITYPVRFRGRVFASVAAGGVYGRITLNHTSAYENNLVTPAQPVSAWNTVDLNLSYDLPFIKGVSLAVDVSNLFNTRPPFVNTDGGYDPMAASALGRLVGLSVSKRW